MFSCWYKFSCGFGGPSTPWTCIAATQLSHLPCKTRTTHNPSCRDERSLNDNPSESFMQPIVERAHAEGPSSIRGRIVKGKVLPGPAWTVITALVATVFPRPSHVPSCNRFTVGLIGKSRFRVFCLRIQHADCTYLIVLAFAAWPWSAEE